MRVKHLLSMAKKPKLDWSSHWGYTRAALLLFNCVLDCLMKIRFHLPRPFNPHKPGIETGVSSTKDRNNTHIYIYI